MDVVALLISLVSGAIGGNVAGAAMPDKSLGAIGNSVAGLLGGGVGGYILQALELLGQTAPPAGGAPALDFGTILANAGSGGVGGAILVAVVAIIKNAMQKRS